MTPLPYVLLVLARWAWWALSFSTFLGTREHAMSYKTAQRTVANPLAYRRGGTKQVDLAVGADEAVAGMREGYSYNRGPDKVTTYSPNREGSPFDDYAYGAGDVTVTEMACEEDGALESALLNDVQPEGGRMEPVARYSPTTRRRD